MSATRGDGHLFLYTCHLAAIQSLAGCAVLRTGSDILPPFDLAHLVRRSNVESTLSLHGDLTNLSVVSREDLLNSTKGPHPAWSRMFFQNDNIPHL